MAIDLNKKAEKVGLVLTKRGIIKVPTMKVAAVLDVSPSEQNAIRRGDVQNALDQIAGVGVRFDDDGTIDVFQLYDGADYVGACTVDDAGSYMVTEGMTIQSGTAYAPAIRLVTDAFFVRPAKAIGKRSRVAVIPDAPVKKPSLASRIFGGGSSAPPTPQPVQTEVGDMPVFAFIATDGEPLNEGDNPDTQYRRIAPALEYASDYPIYFQIVGVTDNAREQFEVCKKLAEHFPNVGFTRMSGFNRTDDEFYDAVITQKFANWLKANVAESATA